MIHSYPSLNNEHEPISFLILSPFFFFFTLLLSPPKRKKSILFLSSHSFPFTNLDGNNCFSSKVYWLPLPKRRWVVDSPLLVTVPVVPPPTPTTATTSQHRLCQHDPVVIKLCTPPFHGLLEKTLICPRNPSKLFSPWFFPLRITSALIHDFPHPPHLKRIEMQWSCEPRVRQYRCLRHMHFYPNKKQKKQNCNIIWIIWIG